MNSYLSYFLHGLQKYCGRFPVKTDLPVFPDRLPSAEPEVWLSAMQLNYGKAISEGKPVQFRSVFEFLKNGTKESEPFGFHPLSLKSDSIFPGGSRGDFQTLIEGFKNEWEHLKKIQPENFTDTLVFLSKKWFSSAGFSPEMPHVSLHEHLKTTAALADCLQRSEKRKVLLVGVGLDNIQGFCYDIASSKAAKSLKGRSFFLQMLLDTISREIISKMDATLGHIVYARGGKAFLLLPDSTAVRQALDKIKTELSAGIWEKYRSSLFMFLKYEPFDEQETDFSNVWKRLQAKIRTDKQQKNLEMLTTDFDTFFKPIEEGFRTGDVNGDKQFCRVTGELIKNAVSGKNNIESDQTEAPVWVSDAVKFQSDLGEALRESKEYIQWQAKEQHQIADDQPIFTGSKTFLSVPEGSWSLRHARPFKNDFKARFRLKLNELDFLPASPNGMGCGFAFYGGNEQAVLTTKAGETRVKFYSELAGQDENGTTGEGFTRLGIGRMDVDGLSKMAEKAESSFALNATFSARLDLFLSGYINTVRASNKEYEENLNIVFSGGDDMLIVGRWDLTLDFLTQLRADFSKFQGGDFLTMSAGLALVTPKFPIAKAVQLAGTAEDKAKDFNREDPKTGLRSIPALPEKNAFCFLGEVISWQDEFDFVLGFSKKLLAWLEPDSDTGISMSLIFKIYRFHEMQCDGRPDWRWLSAWYFQHCEKENSRKSKAIFNCLKVFVMSGSWKLEGDEDFKCPPDRALMLLSLGGRIADFKKRNDKNLKLKS